MSQYSDITAESLLEMSQYIDNLSLNTDPLPNHSYQPSTNAPHHLINNDNNSKSQTSQTPPHSQITLAQNQPPQNEERDKCETLRDKYRRYPCPDPTGVEPSDEQCMIMVKFEQGYNVRIDACAGSGKTTMLLQIARILITQQRTGLIVTYNRTLCDETRLRVKNMGLDRCITVETFHSACGRAYGMPGNVREDMMFKNLVDCGPPQHSWHHKFQVLIIDECQDMTQSYAKLIQHMTYGKDQMVMVGDARQCINMYRGGNCCYFRNPQSLCPQGEWVTCTMLTSYRLTEPLALFVESALEPSPSRRIIGGNLKSEKYKPIYVRFTSQHNKKVAQMIVNEIEKNGIDNVAILSRSVRVENQPKSIKYVEEILADRGLGIFTKEPNREYDRSYSVGKLLIATFNSMKGMERDVIFAFINGSIDRMDREDDSDPDSVSNLIYVALTRARCNLYILDSVYPDKTKSSKGSAVWTPNPIHPLNSWSIKEYCTVHPEYLKLSDNPMSWEIDDYRKYSVTDILRYRTIEDISEMSKCITSELISRDTPVNISSIIDIPYVYSYKSGKTGIVEGTGRTPVLHYYGAALTFMLEYYRRGISYIMDGVEHLSESVSSIIQQYCLHLFGMTEENPTNWKNQTKKEQFKLFMSLRHEASTRSINPEYYILERGDRALASVKGNNGKSVDTRNKRMIMMDKHISTCALYLFTPDLLVNISLQSEQGEFYTYNICRLILMITIRMDNPNDYPILGTNCDLEWFNFEAMKCLTVAANTMVVPHLGYEKDCSASCPDPEDLRRLYDERYERPTKLNVIHPHTCRIRDVVINEKGSWCGVIDYFPTTICETQQQLSQQQLSQQPQPKQPQPKPKTVIRRIAGLESKAPLNKESSSSSYMHDSYRIVHDPPSNMNPDTVKYFTDTGGAISSDGDIQHPNYRVLNYRQLAINGRSDITVDNGKMIFELKVCKEDSIDHFLQLAVYLALDYMSTEEMKVGYMCNVATGCTYKITLNDHKRLLEILHHHVINWKNLSDWSKILE